VNMGSNVSVRLGIVILNYNDYTMTQELLKNVRYYDDADEIVVVDNGSSNESLGVLSKFQSQNIHVISAGNNGGYSSGNNIGIRYLRDNFPVDIVCIANPDVEFSNDTLLAIKKCYANTDYPVFGPVMLNIDYSVADNPCWDIPTFYADCLMCFWLFRKLQRERKSIIPSADSYLPVEVLPGSFFAARDSFLKTINDLDEHTFLYCEERILAWHVKNAKMEECLITSATYRHVHGATTQKYISSVKKHRLMLESREYFNYAIRGCGKVKRFLFRLCSSYSMIEYRLLAKLKNMHKDKAGAINVEDDSCYP